MSEILNAATGIALSGGAAASGGLLGVVGSIGGRVLGFFERKSERKHALALLEHRQKQYEHELKLVDKEQAHERQLHELNMKAARQQVEDDLAVHRQQASYDGLEASMKAEAAIGKASRWVINTLRLVRPLLTLMLWIITAWIFSKTKDQSIADAAVFAATAATLWWFGDRAPSHIKPKSLNYEL